ncbi:MAG TPA: outer membrane beta-barrel protein [Candidatus Angelobacter sp.]|nr:outer membrane beta-barrel protein [Candidatus Angelobacter sp.]
MRLIDLQCSPLSCFVALATLVVLLSQACPPACAQDSPGRFEVGGNFTALRFNGTGNFGPGVEGDVNFGRHFALDAAFNWLPANRYEHITQGLFGGKAGVRTEHFGFFGKVRPGFISRPNQLREETIVSGVASGTAFITVSGLRVDRLTERALDFGGVVEYYPSKHWALRYDLGDTVVFGEGVRVNFIGGPPLITSFSNGNTTHNFQFSTSVHYRF